MICVGVGDLLRGFDGGEGGEGSELVGVGILWEIDAIESVGFRSIM